MLGKTAFAIHLSQHVFKKDSLMGGMLVDNQQIITRLEQQLEVFDSVVDAVKSYR